MEGSLGRRARWFEWMRDWRDGWGPLEHQRLFWNVFPKSSSLFPCCSVLQCLSSTCFLVKTTTLFATTMTTETDAKQKLPGRLQFWLNLSASLPLVEIFGLESNIALTTVMVLAYFRYMAMIVLVIAFQWSIDDGAFGASALVACLHSLTLVPSLYHCFVLQGWYSYQPSEAMPKESSPWHSVVTCLLQFCTGYMIYDAILNIVVLNQANLTASDWMFLGHHAATALYMTSTRWIGAGHQSAMMCMFLGELTNPLHNSFYFLEKAVVYHPSLTTLLTVVQWLFSVSYVLVRALVAPPILLYTTYDLWKSSIHKGWVLLWTLLIWGVAIGSYPWILDCYQTVLGGGSVAAEL